MNNMDIFSNEALELMRDAKLLYKNAEPFPHVKVDNFFTAEVAECLYDNFYK